MIDRSALYLLPLPSQRNPFDIMCLFLLDRTYVKSGYTQEFSSGKREHIEQKSLCRTAGNLLGGRNFLSCVRKHFHTSSFLPPARRIAVLSRPAVPMQGTRLWQHKLACAQGATGVCCSQKPQCCHLGLPSHLGTGGASPGCSTTARATQVILHMYCQRS